MVGINDPGRRQRSGAGSPRVAVATLTLAAVSVTGVYWLIEYGDTVPLLLAIAASWSTKALVRALH